MVLHSVDQWDSKMAERKVVEKVASKALHLVDLWDSGWAEKKVALKVVQKAGLKG